MKNIYTKHGLLVVCLLLLSGQAMAQTDYLKQFFTSPGPYTSKTPNDTQFDSIYVISPAVLRLAPGQGYVEFERNLSSGGGSGRIVRSTDFSPTPSTVFCQFRVNVVSAPENRGNAIVFNFGQNFSPSNGTLPPNAQLFSKMQIDFAGDDKYFFRQAATNSNSRTYSGSVQVTWVMNNTDKQHYYATPTREIDTLAPQTFDIWINTERFLKGKARVSSSSVQTTDFSLQFRDGVGVVRFTDFIIQDIEGVNPVHLTYFNAVPIDNQVELNWETAWEQNSREFIVERSSDLKEFGRVGRVAAAGESDGRRQYAFTDFNPPSGDNYYRLRMVDADGTYEYSKVRDVTVQPGAPTLLVAPNPASGNRLRVRASGVDVSALRLTTILGQDISFRIDQKIDGYLELIPAATLAPGMYFLSTSQDGLQTHTKVLVRLRVVWLGQRQDGFEFLGLDIVEVVVQPDVLAAGP